MNNFHCFPVLKLLEKNPLQKNICRKFSFRKTAGIFQSAGSWQYINTFLNMQFDIHNLPSSGLLWPVLISKAVVCGELMCLLRLRLGNSLKFKNFSTAWFKCNWDWTVFHIHHQKKSIQNLHRRMINMRYIGLHQPVCSLGRTTRPNEWKLMYVCRAKIAHNYTITLWWRRYAAFYTNNI